VFDRYIPYMEVYNICRMIKYITQFCHGYDHDLNAYHYFIIISGSTLVTQSESVGTPIRGPDQIGRDAAVCPVIFCAEVSCSAGPRGLHFHLLYLLGSKCISLLSFPR